VKISLTPKNTLRAMDKGKIQVTFPLWDLNTGDPSISGNPVCSPVTKMSPLMSCSLRDSILTVSNPVSSDQTGSLIEFQVTGFRNPYNAKTMTGFIVRTTDEKNNLIDSSEGIASPPSLKVTGFAQFTMVQVNRNAAGD